ncbi:MAG TPA: hypothetical protein H9694_11290, partial [Firmicutes bacterium]|nr:hypothetical protein [Bacillota bacterium]
DKLFFKIPALREQTMRNRLPYSITKKEKSQLKTPYENRQKFMPIFYVGRAFSHFGPFSPFRKGEKRRPVYRYYTRNPPKKQALLL